MITKEKYVEYLISTPINYTCTNLAEHLDEVSHDVISNYLKRERLTARHLWELVQDLIDDSPDAYLIIDDSVQNKRYSRSIEMVKLQYSGAEGGLVRGIGVVNLVHTNGEDGEYYPLDFRIYAKDADGKTKNDHFQEMLLRAIGERQIQAKTVLFDSWYSSWRNLKLVYRLGLIFYTTLKANRLVSLSIEDGYIHLDEIDWTEDRLKNGIIVKLKKVPFKVKLFKVVATNGNIDWVITNDLDETVITQVAQEANDLRWQVEKFHRELKQLTGSAKCQCRKARSQRNHLACCYHAWLSLKVHASLMSKTIYRVRTDLFSDYLRAELRTPTIPAFQPT
ncbi:MAG: transposase [Anaerolineales bacterium]|nr:transposase [Anaerolineales bacterium]